MSWVAPGQLRIQGTVSQSRAVNVFAVNNHSGAIGGRVVRNKKYSFVLEAQPGDEIELWYEVGVDVSESLFLEAPPLPDEPDAASVAQPDAGPIPDSGLATDAGADGVEIRPQD